MSELLAEEVSNSPLKIAGTLSHDTRRGQIRRGVAAVVVLAVVSGYAAWLAALPEEPAPGDWNPLLHIAVVFAAGNILILVARLVIGRA